MKLIKRDDYIAKLSAVEGTPDIKILSGMRRAGKSKLLEETARRLKKKASRVNVIYADLSLLKNEHLKEYHKLHQWVESHSRKGDRNCVMIDEVQMCPGFELVVNSLHAESSLRYDVYLTGSNAFLLSSDLTTLLLAVISSSRRIRSPSANSAVIFPRKKTLIGPSTAML